MMLRRVLCLCGAIFLVLAKSANGGVQINYSEIYGECISKYGATNNMSVMSCSSSTGKAASEEMESAFDDLKIKYLDDSPEDVGKLEAAQRSWALYRDMQCELAEKYVGSPMHDVCPMRMVIRRLDEIRELLGQ
ncbi:lysozyme inhibitor LprI family protein [Pseudomonas sp. PDM22]|uniref:lysozyme inhibitor LprI family protein n=1 Tax=Pseudomonas sp. PDM22 TaxID=2769287 RepID=UPI0009D98F20|nr:lysozyme inhibitor LprI family protein [Pseudomonas sp. PDM22]MBD9516107.1 DUF1311 domain-containing protein [Pseudomonas sp. PDM22]OQR32891.1 hypothetical protein BWR15_15665 [Pseudomonas sp. T]